MSPAARTPETITADIEQQRDRLAETIDQLVYRVQPKTIVSRQVASIKAWFHDDDGTVDTMKVAKVAGVAVGFVGLIVAIRKIAG